VGESSTQFPGNETTTAGSKKDKRKSRKEKEKRERKIEEGSREKMLIP